MGFSASPTNQLAKASSVRALTEHLMADSPGQIPPACIPKAVCTHHFAPLHPPAYVPRGQHLSSLEMRVGEILLYQPSAMRQLGLALGTLVCMLEVKLYYADFPTERWELEK